MAWIFLVAAGLCEMAWPLGFKHSKGFAPGSWVTWGTIGVMLLSFVLLSKATRMGIPIGTAYAVWTGIGAAGVAAIGMMLYGEPRDAGRLVCLTLIIAGVVGIKFFSPAAAAV